MATRPWTLRRLVPKRPPARARRSAHDRREREHARVGLEALPAQVGGKRGEAREVALDLALGDEDASGAPARAAHVSGALEVGERGADRRARDAEPLRQLALGAEPLPG